MKIAIVEDEAKAAEKIIRYVEKYAEGAGEEITAIHFGNPVDFLEKYHGEYDVIFMDIIMEMMNGMECAAKLRQRDENVLLCFITNMAQYAIRGYEVGAFDFMIKPVVYEEFALKMDRIRRLLDKRVVESVLINSRGSVQKVAVRDLTYVEVYNHVLIYHTEKDQYEAYGKLTELENDERFRRFLRIGTSHLVNCDHISAFENDTIVVKGVRLPVSRRRRKECLEKMAVILGGGWC